MHISFLPAHAPLNFACAFASHFYLLMRISFLPAHAHLILACTWRLEENLQLVLPKLFVDQRRQNKNSHNWSSPAPARVPSVAISILGKRNNTCSCCARPGRFIDQYLTYDEHLTQTAAKCLCKLVQINRIKHLLDKETLLLLINAFVFSKLFYCSTVFSNTSKSSVRKLQRVQNFAARIILGLRKFDHISQGIKSLKWLPVKGRLYLKDGIMMYKCINKLAPDYLADKFVQRSHIHNRNTRSRNQLDIPRCRISTGQRSFVYRGTQLWNSLSYDVRTAKCPKVFKRRWLIFYCHLNNFTHFMHYSFTVFQLS